MQVCIALFSLFASDVSPVSPGLTGLIVYLFLSLVMAWILLMRTTWLADKLNLHEDVDFEGFKEGAIFRTGVKLIGVYVTVNAIPAFAKNILTHSMFYLGLLRVDFWTQLIPTALQLALGVFMAVRADSVLALVAKAEMTENRRILWVGLGIFVGMVMLGLAVTSLRNKNYIADSIAESGSLVENYSGKENTVIINHETNTSRSLIGNDTVIWAQTNSEANLQTKSQVSGLSTPKAKILYFAKYPENSVHCEIIAFDLKNKKELWRTVTKDARELILHSLYRNRVNMFPDEDNRLVVIGRESGCDYVNVLDRKSGKILIVESHEK